MGGVYTTDIPPCAPLDPAPREMQDHAKRTKDDMYSAETMHPQRQLYLLRKRPREIWDPTLWEIPLLPLRKKHKTHWDPNEWEVPCNDETHAQ